MDVHNSHGHYGTPLLITSGVTAAGSIFNNLIGALPDIVSILAGIAAIAAGTMSALLSWEKRQELRQNRED